MLRQSEDTDKKVLDYIIANKTPAGKDLSGEFQQSMIDIGEQIGMSVSTVHRAIERLKLSGYLIVRPPIDKRQPNIIEYIGNITGDFSLEALENLKTKFKEFESAFRQLEINCLRVQKKVEALGSIDIDAFEDLSGYSVYQKTNMPDGKKLLILERKS